MRVNLLQIQCTFQYSIAIAQNSEIRFLTSYRSEVLPFVSTAKKPNKENQENNHEFSLTMSNLFLLPHQNHLFTQKTYF